MKLAKRYGYKIKCFKAYHWKNKAFIFKDYVSTLYENRLKYPETDVKNLISDLLLNSLYSHFGMSPTQIDYNINLKKSIKTDSISSPSTSMGGGSGGFLSAISSL